MLRKTIYLLGQSFRNPSLKNKYAFLKSSENWSLQELENYQLKKLKELLEIAYHNSAFYKNKFDRLEIDITKINTLNDLKSLPILTKEELINFTSEIQTSIKFKNKILATTSGTSGQSLKFYREEAADSFNRAAIQRGYSWYGVQPWDRNGYFWGFNFSRFSRVKNIFFDTLQNRFRIFSYQESELKKFIHKAIKATYIHGYSSMIYQVAVLINKLDLTKPTHIKMIKGTSEKILDGHYDEIQKAFGTKIISEYGATEAGIIAFECPQGNMHISMEGVIVEEVENEILVTNLQMTSFPIIRYKLGDYIALASRNKTCSCGKKHLIIKEVTGRVGEKIYGKKELYPSLYLYYIFKNLSKVDKIHLNYQVIQENKGFLTFYIEQERSRVNELKLIKEIKKYFNEDIAFNIQYHSKLSDTKGKLKNFISFIHE